MFEVLGEQLLGKPLLIQDAEVLAIPAPADDVVALRILHQGPQLGQEARHRGGAGGAGQRRPFPHAQAGPSSRAAAARADPHRRS